jgi:hypothetical protein
MDWLPSHLSLLFTQPILACYFSNELGLPPFMAGEKLVNVPYLLWSELCVEINEPLADCTWFHCRHLMEQSAGAVCS